MKKKLISIIAPMYNEEQLVRQYSEETLHALAPIRATYDLEIVLIDDGSSDRTLENMRAVQKVHPSEFTIIQLARNFGLEGAIQAGLRVASGDGVVVMDADLQDPPAVILKMVQLWESGADIVIGSRAARPNDGLFKRLGARLFYAGMTSLSGKLKLEKEAANFRLLDRKAVDELNRLTEVNGVFRVLVPFLGMRTAVVDYERDRRFAGATKYNLKSMVRYALDGLTGISIEPLRRIANLGFWFCPVSILTGASVFFVPEFWKPTMVICSVLGVLFSILVMVIAVVAEYVGQIHTEVKGRPASIIYDVSSADLARSQRGSE